MSGDLEKLVQETAADAAQTLAEHDLAIEQRLSKEWTTMCKKREAQARLEEHLQYCWTCAHDSPSYRERGIGPCKRRVALQREAKKR